MSNIWSTSDHETERRRRKLARSQPWRVNWQAVVAAAATGLLAGVWMRILYLAVWKGVMGK